MTFLTGMETQEPMPVGLCVAEVYDLPNRDGNQGLSCCQSRWRSVYDLPNRDGNTKIKAGTRPAVAVYDLPNRDGNT